MRKERSAGIILRRRRISLLLLILFCLFTTVRPAGAEVPDKTLSPITNHGKKWRVAYVGMRKSINHPWNLQAIVSGLDSLGWIKLDRTFPWPKTGQTDSSVMWKWLGNGNVSPYLEFLADGYYYTEGTDPEKCAQIADRIIERCNRKQDIDLIIVMGTKAAQSLANDRHRVPIMIFSTTDPISAGVTQSVADSGRDHVWAHLYPTRQRRHVEVFHDIIGFKRLGMVFEDSVIGRSFAGIEQVQAVAKERGFTVVTRHLEEKQADQVTFEKKILKAYEQLAGQVDAMYLTIYAARKFDALPRLLKPFYDRRIPTFTQTGLEVGYGALMSVSDGTDLKGFGRFAGEAIAKVLHGEKPRRVPYIYEHPPRILLNMDVSRLIGYRPPFDILLVADEIYSKKGVRK